MDAAQRANIKWFNDCIGETAEPKEITKIKTEVAERMGIALQTFHVRLRTGKFSTTELEQAAEYFGKVPPSRGRRGHAQTLGNVVPMLQGPRTTSQGWTSLYPVLGKVEAGAFREADMLTQVEPYHHPGPRYTSYPNATLMAWEAHGDSMNQEGIFDGTILFGVDFQEAGGTPSNNSIVVVEQNRGGLIERSVKAVAIFPDRTEFQPRSSDPRHKPITYKNGNHDDNVEVRILTVVLGWYTTPSR